PHQEVSLGYPREWQRRPGTPGRPVRILPAPASSRQVEHQAGPRWDGRTGRGCPALHRGPSGYGR
ncbi:hypothetical protein ABZV20_38600, partial [Streptomyces decoyicus]